MQGPSDQTGNRLPLPPRLSGPTQPRPAGPSCPCEPRGGSIPGEVHLKRPSLAACSLREAVGLAIDNLEKEETLSPRAAGPGPQSNQTTALKASWVLGPL